MFITFACIEGASILGWAVQNWTTASEAIWSEL